MIFKAQPILRRIRDFENVMVTRLVSERTLDILQSSRDFSSRYIIEDGSWTFENGVEIRLDIPKESQEMQPTRVVPLKQAKAKPGKVKEEPVADEVPTVADDKTTTTTDTYSSLPITPLDSDYPQLNN